MGAVFWRFVRRLGRISGPGDLLGVTHALSFSRTSEFRQKPFQKERIDIPSRGGPSRLPSQTKPGGKTTDKVLDFGGIS